MRTIAIIGLSLGLMGLLASPALADLCAKCKDKMYIQTVGQCIECKGNTSSGAFKLCPACSRKLGECEHCRAKLQGAAGADKVKEPGASDANASSTKPADEKGKTDPPGLPLEARLVLKTDTYTLDPTQQGKAFRDSLTKTGKPPRANVNSPDPPAVDITFELTNTGQKDLSVTVGGDMCSLDLKLQGPGAVTARYVMMMTTEYRLGKKVKIEPGKSMTIPITRLAHGMRGTANASYWTEPGEYSLSASYLTAVEGLDLKPGQRVSITSPAVKIKVVAADEKKGKPESGLSPGPAEK
jgi:hypothetical protein